MLRSDGGEYTSNEFREYCAKAGISLQVTPPGTPQLNGVAERINRLSDMVRTMLQVSGLPHYFWGEAVVHAAWVKTMLPHNANG